MRKKFATTPEEQIKKEKQRFATKMKKKEKERKIIKLKLIKLDDGKNKKLI